MALIKEQKIFGFSFYKREREKYELLSHNIERHAYFHPSLSILTYEPELEYGSWDIFSEIDWETIANETIAAGFFCLYAYSIIDIYRYKDKLSYLGGLIKRDKEDFSIKIREEIEFNDPLLKILYACIKKYQDDEKATILNIVASVLDRLLGTKEVSHAEHKVVIELVERNVHMHEWLAIEQMEGAFRKIFKKYKVRLDEDKYKELWKEERLIRKLLKQACSDDKSFDYLIYKVRSALSSEYLRRAPSNDSAD